MALGANEVFKVTAAGALTATSATITGQISASSGDIGGFNIASDSLRLGTGASAGASVSPLNIQLHTNSSEVGTHFYRWGNTSDNPNAWLAGLSLTWHADSNAGHVVVGQVAADATNIKDNFYGIQMMSHTSKEYFCLSADATNDATDTVYNRIAGWSFDDTAIYSGTKVSDGAPAAAGAITIGKTGYISANKFQITVAGEAKFSGSISIADARMGENTSSRAFSDFFEIGGGNLLRAKSTAQYGTNTFQSITLEVNELSCCFLPGTKILMSDGADKNIEEVRIGDVVKSWNEQTGDIENSVVFDLESPIREGYYNLSFDGGELKVTNEHPIYIKNKGWCSIEPEKTKKYHPHLVNVKQIEVGDLLYTSDKQWKNITSFDYVEEQVQTYNISSVEKNHTFFANGVLVHNKLEFTEGHKYFVSSSISLKLGDSVRLNKDNLLEKTDSSKSNECVGIVWGNMKDLTTNSIISGALNYDSESHSNEYINNQLSRSIYVDSFGTIITSSDYILMRVASVGDTREYKKYYDEDTKEHRVITSSLNGFNICDQNGLVSKGDLLCTSDIPGYLMKQPYEYVITSFSGSEPVYEERQSMNSFTVGKVMESCSFEENGKAKGVYGYLYCG